MKHHQYVLITLGIVFVFVLLKLSPVGLTGLAVTNGPYAKTVDQMITDFLPITSIEFPKGSCGTVAKELYRDLTKDTMDVKAGFTTRTGDKVASINFVTDRLRRFGTADLIYGPALLIQENADTLISLNVESMVTVPKRSRVNYLALDLYGYSMGKLYVNRGRFSTPSLDCMFISYNGDVECECNAHTIAGIEVAGITQVRPSEEQYDRIRSRLTSQQSIPQQ